MCVSQLLLDWFRGAYTILCRSRWQYSRELILCRYNTKKILPYRELILLVFSKHYGAASESSTANTILSLILFLVASDL